MYFENMHNITAKLGQFVIENANSYVINSPVEYIINQTGVAGSMFLVTKFYLFDEENAHIDEILY